MKNKLKNGSFEIYLFIDPERGSPLLLVELECESLRFGCFTKNKCTKSYRMRIIGADVEVRTLNNHFAMFLSIRGIGRTLVQLLITN